MDLLIYLFHLILVDPMTNVLVAFARAFGGNFGIAIIVFTLVMRFITWPLTASQYKQSRAMQAIQPRMQELQKKYKGKDPKKLQQETMALYREAGVNPIGCLFPMLAQFPIWIALYQVIRVSLGNTPESLVTLSQRLYPLPYVHEAVPLNNDLLYWNLGQPDTSYLLPVLVAITMYIQQKLITPTPAVGATMTDSQRQQQQTTQMMTWMMPLMFGFFSLSVPAGLALYWAVSNVSGITMQYFYMGRRVDWRAMLQFSPPSAPSQKGSPALQAQQKQKPAPREEEVEAETDEVVEDRGAAGGPGQQQIRRTKHGRRRGKR
jgi:YidC/Oxa1 family membrane protein insertase